MAHSYKNIVITPNIGVNNDPSIQFSGANSSVNTDITLRVYPDSNGTLSFEGSAGQLFSITNDLTGSIFSVNDVSGIPLVEVNVSSQQITLGQFYGNVGIGTSTATSSIYKLDVTGAANISLPTLLVSGTNVLASFAAVNTAAYIYANGVANSANAYTVTVGAASNTWANTVSTSDRAVANAAANSANAYTVTVGAASNTWANSIGAASNAWANTLSTSDRAVANAAANSANAYAVTVGAASNTFANTKVASVTGTSGRITSSGGTTPAIDLATAGAGAATYSSGISSVTVDAYGRVTSVTGSAGYVTSSGVTSVATGTGLTGGTITSTGTLSVDFATVATVANATAAFAFANGVASNTTAAFAAANSKVASVTGTSGRITSSGGTTPAIDLASGVVTPTAATGGISALTVDTYGRVTAITGSAGYVTSSGVTSVATGTGLTGGTITSTGTLSVDFATVATATNTTAAFAAANGKVASVSGTSGRITSSGGTTPAIDLDTAGAGAATYSSGISAVTVDAYGRVTSVTGSAGYVTSSGVTSVATGVGLTGGTITSTGTVSLATYSTGTNAAVSGGISSITVDEYGRVRAVTGSAGYVTSSGVTSVSGTGTVSGLTLSGTVTSTGSLTLGGTLSASIIDNMSDEHRLFNNMGDNHGTRTAFDASAPSYNFGWRYVQGSTNGPGVNGATQYYSEYVGLGNDYAATGAGSYGMFIAYPRNVTTPYITIRYNENNALGAWQKISAGYADAAPWSGITGKPTTVSGFGITDAVTSVTGTSGRITSSGGTTPAIDLATTTVSATTYGGTTQIPSFTVDAYGRLTFAGNNAISSSGGVTIGNEASSATTFYPVFTTTTSGSMSSANVDTVDLTYVPSTGTLSAKVFNSLSDITLKTDIEGFDGVMLLEDINPVSFKWKNNSMKSYGVIAQELEKVFPDLVQTNEQGIKSVSYMPLIGILLDVVKKQQKDIEEIKKLLNKKK